MNGVAAGRNESDGAETERGDDEAATRRGGCDPGCVCHEWLDLILCPGGGKVQRERGLLMASARQHYEHTIDGQPEPAERSTVLKWESDRPLTEPIRCCVSLEPEKR